LAGPAGGAWGVAVASILTIAGWWIGALIAFEVARRLGRPIVSYAVSLERIDRLTHQLSGRTTFWGIVLLRMLLPVEVPSYAFGLVHTITRRTHALATLIGITPFAVLMVMIGKRMIAGEWLTVLWLAVAGLLLLGLVWYLWRRYK